MATVSDAIRICFSKTRRKQTELARRWNTSPQVISNKFYRDYWSGDEMADLAKFFSCQLVFKFPDGMEIPVKTDALLKPGPEPET